MTHKISFQLYSARPFPPLADQLRVLKSIATGDGIVYWNSLWQVAANA